MSTEPNTAVEGLVVPRSSYFPFSRPFIPTPEVDRITEMKDQARQPEVSIILPAYNAHNTIFRTICSIISQQNARDIEIIIADDCSDVPYDVIANHFSRYIRIKVVRMLKNGGPGAARQVGYDHSTGKFVMWMDADDTLVGCDAILKLLRVMYEKDMDVVYGQFLEQQENGDIHVHEQHMVWMFGKLYRRAFLDKYDIRFNTSLSNEDTGFNTVVRCCTNKIWYLPSPVYTWEFKPNSITRINNGMYGQDSGYKGWIDNMVWAVQELMKRFVNKNAILDEILNNYCVGYHFHIENMERYPMNTDISLNWMRGYYQLCIKPIEEYVTEGLLLQHFAGIAANQNIASKGIIPRMTFYEFHERIKSEPLVVDPNHEICGATPAGHIPVNTSREWPVEIHDYSDNVEGRLAIDSDTNKSRYGGMKRALGQEPDKFDYDPTYDGSEEKQREFAAKYPDATKAEVRDEEEAPPIGYVPPEVMADAAKQLSAETDAKIKEYLGEGAVSPELTANMANVMNKFSDQDVKSFLDTHPLPDQHTTPVTNGVTHTNAALQKQMEPQPVSSLPSFSHEFKPPVGQSFGDTGCKHECETCPIQCSGSSKAQH